MKRIYAIPGLGTDEKLYSLISVPDTELIILQWPQPKPGINLRAYAQEFLPQIDTSAPFYLMGVSFGGMLCSELSRMVTPERTILISSSKRRSELTAFIRFFRYFPLHRIISEKLHRWMAEHSRWVLGFEKIYLPELVRMFRSMPPNYFSYCIDYIVNWDASEPPANTLHIHGDADRLLRYGYVKADYTINQGTHAMVVHYADRINAILKKELTVD